MKRSDVEGLDEFLEEGVLTDAVTLTDKMAELQDHVATFVDDIETRVGEAKDLLEDITSVSDLDNVEECLDVLNKLATDLY